MKTRDYRRDVDSIRPLVVCGTVLFLLGWGLYVFFQVDLALTLKMLLQQGADEATLEAAIGDAAPRGMVILLATLGMVPCGIAIYRATRTAHAVDADAMTISPGWSIGWFFVPFANLLMPFRALAETYRVSIGDADGGYNDGNLPWQMQYWWGLWVCSRIIGAFATLVTSRSPSDIAGLGTLLVEVGTFLVDIVTAALFVWVMLRIALNLRVRLAVAEAPSEGGV
ncbi:DUF4328 domain-containing protein [uncultured Sphingomonas sp.]|uniref:DUF4328 domain-containing protein n=1 Tax=uncultured Sphingomonas sp. TaxID=158754 RepID=UPI0025E57ACB|nr:DUF4328 domain-containing protein [uncultured Sphingomonas sp.]